MRSGSILLRPLSSFAQEEARDCYPVMHCNTFSYGYEKKTEANKYIDGYDAYILLESGADMPTSTLTTEPFKGLASAYGLK